ncbi:MAG: KpsF/GutQ family sugar-phosphate isomerase [Verrucomicrobia bacterium]|nr:KpsF/GutQ family sugar-phosphate isomerase [Verrucomicrobiota bacterium]
MNYIKRAREVIDIEAKSLAKVKQSLGKDFSAAIDLLLKCLSSNGKIVVTGMGKNLPIAGKISATLASTGSTSVVINPAQAMHGDLGILNKNDVLLCLSYSGESEELTALLPIVRRLSVKVVALTGNTRSALAKHSDVVVPTRIEREACPFNLAPTSSTTVALAVGDAIAMVLLEARGFRKEDYAKLHPGGAIGRALLLKASDIMRSGERMATVRGTDKVKDALVAMTRARSGSAGVVDSKRRVIGIFTDGDLRRSLSKHSDIMNQPVKLVMTPSPICVAGDKLAVDVLRIYEEHNFDDLLVVDHKKRLVGAIDIQDLPKLKIL